MAAAPRTARCTRVHVGARHLARHLAVGEVGQRRGRDRPSRPAPAAGPCPPTSAWSRPCGRHGRAAGRSWPAELAWTKSTMRVHAACCSSFHSPAQPGVMRASRPNAGHLGEDQPGAADGARAVMHQMPVAGHALLRRVHAHRRDHHAVADSHVAQLERLEHRRRGLVDIDVEAFARTCFANAGRPRGRTPARAACRLS